MADLHVHTTRSDGTVQPTQLPDIAAEVGLEAVAITDHDRLPPWSDPYRIIDGLLLVSGIELRVDAGEIGRIDLLGYGIRPTDDLTRTVEELQVNRIDRARRMIDRLEDTLAITLDMDLETGVGRPHLAVAVSEQTGLSEQAVFDRYIGDGASCYVPRDIPSFDSGRRVLEAACDFVVLAHPLRYDDPAAALSLVDELDGIEGYYPYESPVDRSILDLLLDDPALLVTGGSDAHTIDAIGRCGLDRPAFDTLIDGMDVPMD